MNVPPHKHLIVCVIPPQTIVRQCVLAAVSYVSALCGAARAQSAPVAPPLSIEPAVELSFRTELDKTYAIERSTDLQSWAAVEGIFGDGQDVTRQMAASSPGPAYFRLRSDTLPTGGNAPWRLADSTMLLNSPEGARNLVFNANGSGVVLQGATNAPFTWEWLRTGLNGGVCTVALASGELETISMNFLAVDTGAFSNQRTKVGVPSGASNGTFRKVPDSTLVTIMPATLGHSHITFSGSGRPVSLVVKGDGTASATSPTGVVTAPCTYALKTASSAELKLNGATPDSEVYTLSFNGPSCGTYTVKAKKNSVLRREATGAFTIAPQ
jgi:hypothetical protein